MGSLISSFQKLRHRMERSTNVNNQRFSCHHSYNYCTLAGIRTRFWTNLHAFVAVCGAAPGHVVQWRQWHCQLCWVCHRRPNSRRSFNRNKAKKFRPKTTRPSRNWTVKLNTYHPEGRETLRSALGNGYVWFHSSLRSDELKRTLFPRAVSQCFAPFRMICN